MLFTAGRPVIARPFSYMEHIKNQLTAIMDDIKKRHLDAIQRGVVLGKTKDMERLWTQTVQEVWNIRSFAFTDREKGNMKRCTEDFGDELASVIISAIQHWREFTKLDSMRGISEMPTFVSFFFLRQKIYTWLKSREYEEGKKTEALRQAKERELEQGKIGEVPKVNFKKMVEEAQKLEFERRKR